jgi:hypothetical protein
VQSVKGTASFRESHDGFIAIPLEYFNYTSPSDQSYFRISIVLMHLYLSL